MLSACCVNGGDGDDDDAHDWNEWGATMEKLTMEWSEVPSGASKLSMVIQIGLLQKMRSSVLALPSEEMLSGVVN